MWPIWCDTAPLIALQKIRDAFGTGEKDAQFHPYWSQKEVSAAGKGLAVSYYRRPGKALVVIANLSDKTAGGEVDFSTLKVRMIRNAETGKAFADGSALSLAPGDYALFVAEE